MADIFENFIKVCLEVYLLEPVKTFLASRKARQGALKNAKVEQKLLTYTDVLSVVGKAIRGGICHSINRYAKANNKYIKDYHKNKEWSYLKYWDANNLYFLDSVEKPCSRWFWSGWRNFSISWRFHKKL